MRFLKRLLMLLISGFFGLSTPVLALESPKAHAAWWIEQHGVLTLEEEPRIAWVHAVWKRVEASSERSLKRLPQLVLLRSHRSPMALALPDGSVVLNHAAVKVVYEEAERPMGDARMAFLLSHELAHLAMDDFWQTEAFHGIKKMPIWYHARQKLELLLDQRDPGGSGREARLRELQADALGLIAMNAAGYDPDLILQGSSPFFKVWSSRMMEHQKTAAGSANHPDDGERAALLRSQLQRVRGHLVVFDAGTKLLQLGRYEDARILLEEFRSRFPGRAVFNNLGLGEYQLGLHELGSCDPQRVVRFLTSLVADVETLGILTRGAKSGLSSMKRPDCLKQPAFEVPFRRSIDYFTKAAAMDPNYLPARVNLSSARLMGGDAAGAMSAADEVLRRLPGQFQALNNKAVALHEFGRQMGMDTTDRALGLLQRILDHRPDFLPAAYNRAVLLSERKRNASAEEAWQALASLNLPRLYREEVHHRIGKTLPRAAFSKIVRIPPPWPLGVMNGKYRRKLQGMDCVQIRAGDFRARACSGKGLQLFIIGDRVELVSIVPDRKMKQKLKNLHPPSKTLISGGWKTEFHSGLLLDTHVQGSRKAWWFMPEQYQD